MTSSDAAMLNFFSGLAVFGCLVVFVGVVLESSELLIKLQSDMKIRKGIVKYFGKRMRSMLVFGAKFIKPKILPFELIGFAVLVTGLAIELLGSFSAERLQSKENSELAATNALISLQMEQVRSNNLVLESLVSWRTLSDNQIAKLKSILSTRPSKLNLVYVANDPEALGYAIEISKAFTGWSLFSASRTYDGVLVMGVTIIGASDNDADFVRYAFNAADIPFSTKPIIASSIQQGQRLEAAVTIIVGSKPRQDLTE